LGSTTLSIAPSAKLGLIVTSHDTGILNTSTFVNVVVSSASASSVPPPPPTTGNVVVYASDIPAAARHGSWTAAPDPTAASGVKLVTSDLGVTNTSNPLPVPTDYVDVTFNAPAGVPYTFWMG